MEGREVPDLARKPATDQFRKDQHGQGSIQNWLYPSRKGRRPEVRQFKGALVEDTRGRGEDRKGRMVVSEEKHWLAVVGLWAIVTPIKSVL